MEAIIETGGKQYNVAVGDEIKIEKLSLEKGESFTIDSVLAILNGDKTTIGAPNVKGAKVICEVLDHIRDEKIIVFKKRRRQNYRSKQGHRQDLSVIKVKEIKS